MPYACATCGPLARAGAGTMSGAIPAPFKAAEPTVQGLTARMDELFDLVFNKSLPGINERVKASFRTPFRTLHYLQSLVSVVLGADEPACAPGTEKFWKHLHRCASPRCPRQRCARVRRARRASRQSQPAPAGSSLPYVWRSRACAHARPPPAAVVAAALCCAGTVSYSRVPTRACRPCIVWQPAFRQERSGAPL